MKFINAGAAGIAAVLLAAVSTLAQAQNLQPYVLAYSASAPLAAEVESVKSKLTAAGFEVVGDFSPYAGAHVVGVTSPALKEAAAKDESGAFGAVEHVALTEAGGKLQVSYLNPVYMAAAYRMSSDLSEVKAGLKSALGAEREFGTEKGRSKEQLRKFNYMVGMEHLDDFYELGSHASYEEAVRTVEANLRNQVAGTGLVYKIEIPGKKQTLFGVSRAQVKDQAANDKHIMADTVDKMFDTKTTAYLPYQVLVNDKDVIAMHMRFRMSVWHPDLTMMTFSKLMSSPAAIKKLLAQVAGGKNKEAFSF
jgi:hypothetical protein